MERVQEATMPKPGTNPLADSYLRAAAKEIEQTAVAVSVVGTSTWKLKQMAGLTEPVADALVGERPEVSKFRTALKRLAHNVRVSKTDARQASAALRALAQGLKDAQKLVSKGLGKAEPETSAADFDVVNSWGYSSSEVRDATRALEKASAALRRVGLLTAAGGLAELNPAKVKSGFVQYDRNNDVFLFDLKKSSSNNAEHVLRTLAERLWFQEFGREDRETWGSERGLQRFSGAFAAVLSNQAVNQDIAARLEMTVGKLTDKWPSAKAVKSESKNSVLDFLLQEVKYKIGTRRERKDGVWQKTEQPDKWKKVKGTFGQTAKEMAAVEAKNMKELASVVEKLGQMVAGGGMKKGTSVGGQIKIAKQVRNKHGQRYAGLMEDLKKIAGPYEVQGRTKDLASILGKITRRDDKGRPKYKSANDLGDVTGTRIITDSVGEIYDIIDRIHTKGKKYGIKVVDIDDKVKQPQGEAKYRSVHLEIQDKDGLTKELQIRTRRQNIVSDWSHDAYKPFNVAQRRALQRHKTTVLQYASRASDYFYIRDLGKEADPPKCPRVVSLYFGCLT